MPGPGERTVDIYHGNSWRLFPELEGHLRVMGRGGWRSRHGTDNRLLIDFQPTDDSDGCAYWALSGDVTDAELLRIAQELH